MSILGPGKSLIIFSCLAVALCATRLCIPAAAAVQADQLVTLTVRDHKRVCLVHCPPGYMGNKKLPLLICLHGGLASYRSAIKTFGLSDTADQQTFIVAYPNGSSRFGNRLATWNTGACCGYAKAHNIDDVAFIRQLLALLQENFAIDADRIYVVGFSHGGTLAYRLAAEMPGVFAGTGAISGFIGKEELKIKTPLSVFIVHGTEDKSVPVNGGAGKWSRYGVDIQAQPLKQTVEFWIQANACLPQAQITQTGAVSRYLYEGGTKGTEVELYLINGYGHAWPGGRRAWLFAAQPYGAFSANAALWKFFMQHPRQQTAAATP